jgi:hypothetical protein
MTYKVIHTIFKYTQPLAIVMNGTDYCELIGLREECKLTPEQEEVLKSLKLASSKKDLYEAFLNKEEILYQQSA